MAQAWSSKYKTGKRIRDSGQGTVYKCWRIDDESQALVVKHFHDSRSPTSRARIYRETELLNGKLNHEGLAKIVDHNLGSEETEDLYVVMEFVPGDPLSKVVSNKERIPFEDSVEITLSLLDIIEYCHSMNVIHRDIKPANIILRPTGKPVLIDFGIAYMQDNDFSTETSDFFGNQFFRLTEYETPNPAMKRMPTSDITMLAGIFLYMITGKEPRALLDGETGNMPHQKTGIRQVLEEVVPREKLWPVLGLFDKAFSYGHANRYQSAGELREALTKIAALEMGKTSTKSGSELLDEYFARPEIDRFAREWGDLKLLESELDTALGFIFKENEFDSLGGHRSLDNDAKTVSIGRKHRHRIAPSILSNIEFELKIIGREILLCAKPDGTKEFTTLCRFDRDELIDADKRLSRMNDLCSFLDQHLAQLMQHAMGTQS